MMNLMQLTASTARFMAGRPKNPTIMTKIQTLAAIPVGNVFVCAARFKPWSEHDMPFHEATIVFHNMEYTTAKDDLHNITVELEPGKIVYMNRPKVSQTEVRVRCTCSWTYFAYSFSDNKAQAWAGSAAVPYVRSTAPPPYGRPYVNPSLIPGLCKHLLDFSAYLIKKGVIVK